MSLSILSNFAANVATRNLAQSSKMVSASVARLSSGQRIISAKDDAAALAIGSKLRAEVSSLRQAQINTGQATSMLQVVDGAYTQIDNILVRMKTLAVQAGSDQVSDADRGRINEEYQELLSEITRISKDTKFNDLNLIGEGHTLHTVSAYLGNTTTDTFDTSNGIVNIRFAGNIDLSGATATLDRAQYRMTYAQATRTITFTLTTDANSAGEAARYVGIIPGTGSDINATIELQAQGTNADTSQKMYITINDAFVTGTDVTAASAADIIFQGQNTSTYTFKVGTGTTTAEDDVSVVFTSTTAQALGLTGTSISTKSAASSAQALIDSAINTVASARAELGGSQSRFDFASANVSTSIENTEAARSALLDVDVAAEISKFTSQQILVQAGVSMLSQAQTLPQNLLQLFQ